jgi:hypothetical protein
LLGLVHARQNTFGNRIRQGVQAEISGTRHLSNPRRTLVANHRSVDAPEGTADVEPENRTSGAVL